MSGVETSDPTVAECDLEALGRVIPVEVDPDAWRPTIVRLEPGQAPALRKLCERRSIDVVDRIDHQLADLARVRIPGAGHATERHEFAAEAVRVAGDEGAFGRWVFFPWERRLVHLLSPEDYVDVITDRNRNKITREERDVLVDRTVGVMGLSVGGEAAMTLAQEHLCGHLKLADFDRLDLSNLNRLNGGCDDLGVRKTALVARRVVKLDPYLRISTFHDGVTPENMHAFLDDLDLLVEECDDIAVKRSVRTEAAQRGLNVVFAADERGFLSVEPYGSAPELEPFHGCLPPAPPSGAGFEDERAFFEALTAWMGGMSRISERSRQSLSEIGSTLSGYPQLASEARFAAGQIGHVARCLLLGQRLAPFLGNVDLAELLPG